MVLMLVEVLTELVLVDDINFSLRWFKHEVRAPWASE